jgi:hypothetical protein
MNGGAFKEGHLAYTVEEMEPQKAAAVLKETWQNGFLAFSNAEIRLAGDTPDQLAGLTLGRVEMIESGVSGYLMEAGLWRKDVETGHFVEVVLEREGDHYFVQRWELDINPASGNCCNCFYRETATLPAREGLFKKEGLGVIEVIVPGSRLHFFITTGGARNAKTED